MSLNLNLEDPTVPDIFIEPDDLLTKLVRYGLYMGAVFQLICIFAVIFIKDESRSSCADSDTESSEISPQLTPRKSHHRSRKMEKKKKR